MHPDELARRLANASADVANAGLSGADEPAAALGAWRLARLNHLAASGDQAATAYRQARAPLFHLLGAPPAGKAARKFQPTSNGSHLRIGLLGHGLGLGGAERWMVELVKHVGGVAWSVGVGRGKIHLPLADLLDSMGVESTRDTRGLAEWADVMLVWGVGELSALRDFAGPLVYVSHGCGPWQERCQPAIERATHLTAVSRPAARALAKRPVTVLHNGSDLRAWGVSREQMRAIWGVGPNEIVVGYIGRLGRDKNAAAAARAARQLGCRAVLIGGGRGRDKIAQDAREALPGVVVEPPLENVGDALRAMDVFVLASPSEGMSLALIEAWLAGAPAVATRVGAVPELEDEHGPLVTPVPIDPSPEILADAVRCALSPSGLAVATKAQKIAQELWTAEAMGKRWTEYLASVTKGMEDGHGHDENLDRRSLDQSCRSPQLATD